MRSVAHLRALSLDGRGRANQAVWQLAEARIRTKLGSNGPNSRWTGFSNVKRMVGAKKAAQASHMEQ
jgi:hypothetical protein